MNDQPKFGHMVFFTLKDNSREKIERLVGACHKFLADHPGTVYFSVGVLADTRRDVNDRDYDVALHLIFADRAAHDAYQTAPRHDQFIAVCKENWKQVRVFDSTIA